MPTVQENIGLLIVFVSAVITSLAVVIISLVYAHQKNQILQQSSFEMIRLKYEAILTSSRFEIQESTFNSISKEIHDNINSSLTLAKLTLNTIDWYSEDIASKQVKCSVELLSDAIENLTDISKSLNSDTISSYGLINAIEREFERLSLTGKFIVNFKVLGDVVYFDAEKELIIFRIIQESLNNIIKHSNAKNVLIKILFVPNLLTILISDDGNGFSVNTYSDAKGSAGLKNMRARAAALQGSIEIISSHNNGTNISIHIPY